MSSYTYDQVSSAFNRAADEIIEAIDAGDEGKRDVVNAVINVGMHYLKHPGEDLENALGASYGSDPSEVLDWCRR